MSCPRPPLLTSIGWRSWPLHPACSELYTPPTPPTLSPSLVPYPAAAYSLCATIRNRTPPALNQRRDRIAGLFWPVPEYRDYEPYEVYDYAQAATGSCGAGAGTRRPPALHRAEGVQMHRAALPARLKRKWEQMGAHCLAWLHLAAQPRAVPSTALSSSSYSYFANASANSGSASTSSSASSHPSLGAAPLSAPEPPNAAVLDGICEGVQGVSIIAAGHHSVYTESVLNSHSHGCTHSKNSSLSTLATTTTTKLRFSLSQSSQSSLGEEPPLTPNLSARKVDGVQVQDG
ncbi:hypothetical protein B0H14DRAFT_3172794 [Mycena olivaceomarginata]|nr:hypothetical protein B0H14DRAFT_3172794 [Mycena olivaceomarginata]